MRGYLALLKPLWPTCIFNTAFIFFQESWMPFASWVDHNTFSIYTNQINTDNNIDNKNLFQSHYVITNHVLMVFYDCLFLSRFGLEWKFTKNQWLYLPTWRLLYIVISNLLISWTVRIRVLDQCRWNKAKLHKITCCLILNALKYIYKRLQWIEDSLLVRIPSQEPLYQT